MKRTRSILPIALLALVLLLSALSGCSFLLGERIPARCPAASYLGPVSRVEGKQFLVRDSDGVFQPFFVKGVDIGAAKPAFWPGEFGIEESDYLRWFELIGDMNANTIRVYVPQMPGFYRALSAYNQKRRSAVVSDAGIYMNEELIENHMDAFLDELLEIFHRGSAQHDRHRARQRNRGETARKRGRRIHLRRVRICHRLSAGHRVRRRLRHHGTNEKHPDKTEFSGTYVYTENASPFEVFLAETQELMIDYETTHYGVQRPIAITNWITTDPLSHPGEPNPVMEDAVSVDVEHIKATDAYTAGFFASYHIYPYYPDLMSFEEKYISGENPNPYRAYLAELNAYHTMPVLVAEFGIPTSRGMTHENVLTGYNQGHVEETAQGEMIVSMMNDIRETDCMGGLIFAWQDEWFKRTWNTKDQEEAERRPYWFNVQSPEKTFGLLAFDAGETTAVLVDGDAREWRRADVLLSNGSTTLSVKSDEAYLYFLIRSKDLTFDADKFYIAADTIPEQGNASAFGMPLSREADFWS
ncbi:MAG: hypothetical protein R2881_01765 [Eubacteriales bacterium]